MGNYPFHPVNPQTMLAPSGDATGATDAAAIQAAWNALPDTGGTVSLAAGTWNIECGQLVLTGSGKYLNFAPGAYILAVGAGDVFRMYDSSVIDNRTMRGGGILGFPVIDGTNTTGNSCGLHAGDIFQLVLDVQCQNFTAGTTSKNIWLDNNYYWTEQAYGRLYSMNGSTLFQFDNSVNTSGDATGSFDRCNLDLYLEQGNASNNGIVFAGIDNAVIYDGKLGIYGNFVTGSEPTAAAVIDFTVGNSVIQSCELNIGVELDGDGAYAPQTISFVADSNCGVSACTGTIDFGAADSFAASNNGGQFQLDGTIRGDSTLTQVIDYGERTQGTPYDGYTFYPSQSSVLYANAGASDITGLIIYPGQHPGQILYLINTGSGTWTFAAAADSNVADGDSDIIDGGTARGFIWEAASGLWYRMG